MLTSTDPATAVGSGADIRSTPPGARTFYRLWRAAMSNARARADTSARARAEVQQAALRRAVTLVARGSSLETVFAAVAEELRQLVRIAGMTMVRYEPDGTAGVVGRWGQCQADGGENIIASLVHRTGRSARIREHAVGAPIVVDGRVWGALLATSQRCEALPPGTEPRLEEFTELVAAAISNFEARAELAASRARIVAAADAERRRVVRDLHDGAQQRLVHTVVTLRLARQALERDEAVAEALVDEALDHAQHAIDELRELSHGVLPATLTHGGLRRGIEAVASRMPMPVKVDVTVGRLPARVEATAYFVVAEALTNVVKHARANLAAVSARVEDDTLHVTVRDDGVGGARPDGTGLVGIADRLAALDGRLRVETPPRGGTLLVADIHLPD